MVGKITTDKSINQGQRIMIPYACSSILQTTVTFQASHLHMYNLHTYKTPTAIL